MKSRKFEKYPILCYNIKSWKKRVIFPVFLFFLAVFGDLYELGINEKILLIVFLKNGLLMGQF
jgi:hypothetical protein